MVTMAGIYVHSVMKDDSKIQIDSIWHPIHLEILISIKEGSAEVYHLCIHDDDIRKILIYFVYVGTPTP